ncbi:metal-dependent hydrolase [Halorussus vallis]|nr:metal-dependent hydrolase [Halorussus vallis]USZ77165.1 metal-dependent hydrolase [Halorussus vallis]
MFRPGHYGVTLTLYAPVGCWLVATGDPVAAYLGGAGALWLTMSPDWDSRVPFITHRGSTHTLLFAALLGAAAWVAATLAGVGTTPFGPTDLRTFAAGVASFAVLSHLVADLLTPMGVAVFWPLTSRRYTASLVRASNRTANYLLFALGVFATAVAAYLGLSRYGGGSY